MSAAQAASQLLEIINNKQKEGDQKLGWLL